MKDKKVAFIDTVYTSFAQELIENIKKLKLKKIDYLIANHVEKDHSGALPFLLEAFPEIEKMNIPIKMIALKPWIHLAEKP